MYETKVFRDKELVQVSYRFLNKNGKVEIWWVWNSLNSVGLQKIANVDELSEFGPRLIDFTSDGLIDLVVTSEDNDFYLVESPSRIEPIGGDLYDKLRKDGPQPLIMHLASKVSKHSRKND